MPYPVDLHWSWITPFVLMLAAIALLPICTPHWWEKNLNKFLVSLLLGVPVLIYFGFFFPHGAAHLAHTAAEYLSFIIMLTALYVISGGIYAEGDIRATPAVNTALLLIGSVLASFMGTTGAAMVLIRPLLNINAERKNVVHTVVFFIFLAGNIGGCLTPLGDPPLFMGYLFGVPFTWTFQLWQEWLLTVAVVSGIYFALDSCMHSRESEEALLQDRLIYKPIRLHGTVNVLLLAGVVLSLMLFTAAWPRNLALIALAVVSLLTTKKSFREMNKFTYAPIIEVAVLFFGIFLTMVPAIYLLRMHGAELGVTEPWQFFWAAGMLSAFLDNTPTYVVFFNLAQSLNAGSEIAGMPARLLTAISLGAVFFGAMTYIGNAPNFMVKAIAEERKIKMPSFFGYMLYSSVVLIPVFVLMTFIWF